MANLISFGPGCRGPAPERWGCTNLEATPILSEPCVVEHHYGPGGEMHEHPGGEAVLCVCIGGHGFVKVGSDTSELHANHAVIWPAGVTHKLWTTDSTLTVLLIHFPGRETLTPAPEEWRAPA
jgi:mannose-6-phosphate isomerase-like protein (cupin superfamily)